ncbi:MAG: hypothetical protein QOE17_2366, partial [Gaiellales bacterium]|nr:hypothetical protein [Gaiellales bacterium]
MDESRARQLLAAERERIKGEASALGFEVEDDL